MAGRIFISYRRGDEPGFAGRLFDKLEQSFGRNQLFIDVDNIAPGRDFVAVLENEVNKCDVLLVIVGQEWLTAVDEQNRRRLDKTDDFVRIEIESALKLDKRVIPVLVNDTQMPRAEDLPDTLKPLARRHAIRLTHERFRADAEGLVKGLESSFAEEASARADAERNAKISPSGFAGHVERQSPLTRIHPAIALGILGAAAGAIAFGPLTAWAVDIGNGRTLMWAPALFAGLVVALGALVWGAQTLRVALLAGLAAGAAWFLSDWVITASGFIEKTEWEAALGIPAFKYFVWGVANGISVVGVVSLLVPGLRTPPAWLLAGIGTGLASIAFGQDPAVIPVMVAGALAMAVAMAAVGLGLRPAHANKA